MTSETERLLENGREDDERLSTPPEDPKTSQIIVVLLVCLCEPVVAFMPMPFFAKMVTETGITHGDPTKVGFYVGMIESTFFLTQAIFILQWGRLSDKIGRRPVLMIGLVGLILSMICLGLSKSFAAVVASRAIAGVLNGNVGVAKTMIAELTTEGNRGRVLAWLPVTWIAGATITPIIGGFLQHPAERFAIFAGNKFLIKYPYFVPCCFAASCAGACWIFAYFMLTETLVTKQEKRDPKHYGSISTPHATSPEEAEEPAASVEAGSIRAVITRPVIIAVLNYGWLAFLEISYWAILTVFLPIPFAAGGLSLPPPTVGLIFGALGAFDGAVQIIAFPTVLKWMGPKKIMIITMITYWGIFAMFPVMHELAIAFPTEPGKLHPAVWTAIGGLILIAAVIDMGYGVNFLFISSAAPDPTLLGTTNGLAQMVISFLRALGPFGATSLFSVSMGHPKFLGLHGYGVFVLLAILTGCAVWFSTLLPEDPEEERRQHMKAKSARSSQHGEV